MTPATLAAARRDADLTSLRLTTWNVGRGTWRNLAEVMAYSDVVGCQEMSDRHDLVEYALAVGWQVVRFDDQPGQAATVLLVAPHVKVLRAIALPMLARRYVGRGAGPDHNKPKWSVGALLRKDRVIFGAVSTHLVASQHRKLRRQAAERHVRHLVERFGDRHFPWFVLADCNEDYRRRRRPRALAALYRAGWTNTHKLRRRLRTHGRRAIDYVWWPASRRVNLLTHRTIPTSSDHRALRALFLVGVTPKR